MQLIERVIDSETGGIEVKPFDIGPCGLIVNGTPTFEQWRTFGDTLRAVKNAVQWAVGDWINYGETHYGDKYAQALDETKYAYGTLRNYASVAERVDLSHRVTGLSWSHHAAVASLAPDDQTEVLQEAAHKQLGRDDVKAMVDERKGVKRDLDKTVPPIRETFTAAGWNANVEAAAVFMAYSDVTAFIAAVGHDGARVTIAVEYNAQKS